MTGILEQAVAEAKSRWPSKTAAALLSISLGGGLLILLAQVDLSGLSLWHWLAVTAATGAPWAIWAWATRTPRHKKGSVGFGVALTYEDPDQARRLKADFINRLRQRLAERRAIHPFHFIEFSGGIAARIKGREEAEALQDKSRGHFLIFGEVRERRLGGETHHVLELNGLVRHAPASRSVSERLAAEFREVLPRSLLVAAENDLFTLDFTAQWIDVVTRYIVGIASLISGDLTYSEDLFKRLENELGTHEGSLPQSIAVIRNRIPQRLAEVYKVRVNGLADAYRLKRESRLLEEVEPWLDKLREYDDSYYMGHLQRAICAFVLRRDIAGARAALDKCRRVPEPTWRYSLAFLYAYEGDLQRAYREYNRAFRVPPREPSVPVQAEEFIHLILDEEPHKSQLYFCLGMINQHAKMDMSAAQRDFERFLATTAPDQFAEEQKVVQTWLKKINMPRGQY